AAHWLAGIHLKSKAFQTAYDVATQQLTQTEGVDSSLDPTRVALLMDQADAAFEIPEKRNGSIALFDAIANQHPDHPLASSALHSSAFTSLDQGDFATAIKTATRFETKYGDDDFLPDTLEVKAESFLLNDQPAESSQVFEQLVSKFKNHPNHPRWQIRSGLASYMSQEHQTAIDKLTPLVDSMDDKANKAEAQFWIGLSQFEIEDFKSAAQSLANSYATHNRWDRTDETLLKLCRAQFALGEAEAATTTANTLINDYPDTPLLSDLHYRMGEVAYEAENFQDAFEHFEMIIQQYPDSQFLPYALFNAAWCKLELKEYKKSDALFSKLMTQFPTHELAAQAKIGRGASRRKTGDVASSIKDLTEFLDTQPEGKAKTNAMYELALAYVQVKQWDDAIQSFSDLIDTNPDSPQLDRYYYELAWAHRSAQQEDDAMKFFSKIANEAKDSPLAGEANFHVGTQAYNDEKYDEAIAAYTLCLDSKTADNIREKAAYKSAWAHYKQDQFQDAQIAFAKQNKLFATGELYADGMFMEAECLFRLKQFDSALTAYTAAQPVVEESTQVEPKIRWLTMLHGAQCANKIKRYETALSLIESLDNSAADISFKQDGWLEKGVAHAGLKQTDEALASYRKAAAHPGKTGARAHCMVGDMLFKAKNFAAAIDEFKLVYYGFGGKKASPDVREWQAYAIYEAARCNFVQVDGATDLKQKFVTESIAQFEYLLENYGDDRLATEAAKQLKTLKKIEFK
ncbi:MAG: TolA-binding protein, partial [Mariniblastus sp.]